MLRNVYLKSNLKDKREVIYHCSVAFDARFALKLVYTNIVKNKLNAYKLRAFEH
jgi:hypothetical protein